LGMIGSFFLFANHFQVRRPAVLIILIATLLSFSLAAYILLLFSLAFFLIIHARKAFVSLFVFIVLLFTAGYLFANVINDGNNIINTLIIERLKVENGQIAGWNRFSDDFNYYFAEFVKTNKVFFGIGSLAFLEMEWIAGNAGYKVYIVRHGLFGVFLILMFYSMFVVHRTTKMGVSLLLVYMFAFVQRAYPMWEVQLILFITAVSYFVEKEKQQELLR